MDTVAVTFGKELYAKRGRELLIEKTREETSSLLYNKVKEATENNKLSEVLHMLKENVSGIIHLYNRPTFNVYRSSPENSPVGTSLLLLTKAGFISINYIDFNGRVTGDEVRDWYLWGTEVDKDCFCRLEHTLLIDINDKFIQPLQNALKTNLPPELCKSNYTYIRNIIVFGTGAEVLVYDCNIRGCNNGAEFDTRYLSSQVTNLSDMPNLINEYIHSNTIKEDTLTKYTDLVHNTLLSLMINDTPFRLTLPKRFSYVAFNSENESVKSTKTFKEFGQSKDTSNDSNEQATPLKGVKLLHGKTPEQLENLINTFIASGNETVVALKVSDNLLDCMLILG